jgi:soluble lytic murein transglycosylase
MLLVTLLAWLSTAAATLDTDDRTRFRQAWDAAGRGDRQAFEQAGSGLEAYILFPYLQYEDYRFRRSRVPPAEMASFLEQHQDWAFAPGLRNAWLKDLARKGQWDVLARQTVNVRDTRLRCYMAQARIEVGETEGLLSEVQNLWAVGKSQPDACDPAFDWLRSVGGITPALAWKRIELAMAAGNWRLTRYLERYVPESERSWVRAWREQFQGRYRHMDRARDWPDAELQRTMVSISLQRMARFDPDGAMRAYRSLEDHFSWTDLERAEILREVGLHAAVDLSDDALDILAALPAASLDGQILEWWARAAMAHEDWALLREITGRMPPELANDAQWQYWMAMARWRTGDQETARKQLEALSTRTSYYGFLAADALDLPYTICPQQPPDEGDSVLRLRATAPIARSLELRAVGLDQWAEYEWGRATRALPVEELRAAAALAWQESWYDRVIFALGDSGDRRLYDWRFPSPWESVVERESSRQQIDLSWVFGVMRSESALNARAQSSAGALGLMQITPDTARRLSRHHGLKYSGRAQLKQPEDNIAFGTTFMRELLDRFDQNPVLVSGAYNAGPEAVQRWLRERPQHDMATWIETIPYYETRDYIPRVLAFTVIYDWQLGQPVKRVSSRMPPFDSGSMVPTRTADVVCLASG